MIIRPSGKPVVPDVEARILAIEQAAGRDIQGRNITPLLDLTLGNLALAANSILSHSQPSIALVTGFYIGHGDPPNCETDGPPGTAQLAAGLSAIGMPVRIATDSVNADVVRATMAGAGLADTVPLDVVPVPCEGGMDEALDALANCWRTLRPAVSHVIAIERCGPSSDGKARNARGDDMSANNAAFERLFTGDHWTTIAVGDLGNELGMGSLSGDIVARSVPNGRLIWCPVPADIPLIAGISNWAGAAILAAISLLRTEYGPNLLPWLDPQVAQSLLESAVHDGRAVSGDRSGARPYPCMFVDEVSFHELEPTFRAIRDLCAEGLAASVAT